MSGMCAFVDGELPLPLHTPTDVQKKWDDEYFWDSTQSLKDSTLVITAPIRMLTTDRFGHWDTEVV